MVKFTRCVCYVMCPYLLISFVLLLYKLSESGIHLDNGRTSISRYSVQGSASSLQRILKVTRTDHYIIEVSPNNGPNAFKNFAVRKLQESFRTKVSALEFIQRVPRKRMYNVHLNDSALDKLFNYEIHYDNFEITEPNFLSDEDRKQFLALPENVENLGPRPKEKITGIIQAIPNGIASLGMECGWPSKLEEFYSEDPQGSSDILVPLLVPDSAAFQHFLDGTMPKIVQMYHIITAPNVKVLIFPPRDNIVFEMLKKINISTSKLVFYADTIGAKLQINSCITPPLHPLLWRKSRSMLGAPERLPVPVNQSNVILLTRAGSYNGGRHMSNFDEVKELLMNRYSSRLVIFEGDYNLQRSVEIFGKSSILIGVHGGALYNLNFASSDTHVIEFLPMLEYGRPIGRIAHTIIWHMAQLLGQTYWRIHKTSDTSDGDITVPIDKLRTALNVIDNKLNSLS